MAAGDHAAGRAGDQHLDRGGGGGVQRHLAAVGADDHGVGADTGGIQALAHHAQAAGDDGLEVGVGERGRGPLILLPLGQDLVGDRERQARQLLGQDRLDRLLMGGVEVGEQQADGDGLDLRLGTDRSGDRTDLGRVERGDDLAIGVDALGQLEAVAALDQRLRLDPAHVVVGLAVAALDERDVLEAPGGDVGDDRTLALEHGVGRDRGAEPDVRDGGGGRVRREPAQDARHRVGRDREHLPDLDAALAVMGDEVGEGAADIDAEQMLHGGGAPPLAAAACRLPLSTASLPRNMGR